jgi:hypothetical protein
MMTLITRTALQTKYVLETPPSIQEIHDDFETATQKAVDQTKALLEKEDLDKMSLRVMRLEAAGFTNMPEVKEFSSKIIKYNKAKEFLTIAEGYAQKYPNYKFVSINTVINICKKYSLMCAPVGKYKGGVPDKNLSEIADFKVAIEDIYYEKYSNHDRNDVNILEPNKFVNSIEARGYTTMGPVPKFICAPNDHFEFDRDDKVFGEVFMTRFIKDPIVLHFVRNGFLVVSKWGTEVSEPELVNEKMN